MGGVLGGTILGCFDSIILHYRSPLMSLTYTLYVRSKIVFNSIKSMS
jgi:hypothetical protein